MGDSNIALYLFVASLLIVAVAIIAFVIACRSRRRAVRVGVGVILLAVAAACITLSLLAALFIAALGFFSLVLAGKKPQRKSVDTEGATKG
jgi:hypothetical protein